MIIVDPLFHAPAHGHGYWCHMVSTTSVDELHAFADKIGLKRSWFQNKSTPHYDLTRGKRLQAVKNGAIEVTPKEFVSFVRKLRKKE